MKWFYSFFLFSLLFAGVPGGAALAQDKTFTNSIGMEFVLIPAGKFKTAWKQNELDEVVPREVTISQPFYLGKYEVTQEQWVAVMGKNPSYFKGRTDPVEMVSWNNIQIFIQKLNEKEGGNKYRLPTEAEWEHAARAGTETEMFFGDNPADLGDYAWFNENSQGKNHPVGKKEPNPWGLYDIYGNVLEWVQDLAETNKEGKVKEPTGPANRSARVFRGGSFTGPAEDCRSAYRGSTISDVSTFDLGFRLAFSLGQ